MYYGFSDMKKLPLDQFQQDLANFLLVRGPYA
jgi:hypothetical protein